MFVCMTHYIKGNRRAPALGSRSSVQGLVSARTNLLALDRPCPITLAAHQHKTLSPQQELACLACIAMTALQLLLYKDSSDTDTSQLLRVWQHQDLHDRLIIHHQIVMSHGFEQLVRAAEASISSSNVIGVCSLNNHHHGCHA